MSGAMDDLRDLHRRAGGEFDRRVRAVRPDQWRLATPCSEWDVRALVNHLVYENRWAPEVMAGRTVEEVGGRFDGDLLGDDPQEAWARSLDEALAAFAPEDATTRTVHLSFGDAPASEYLTQLTTDLAVHAWDLARAIGDDDGLDPHLVAFVWTTWSLREELIRASGVFGDRVDVPDAADPQTKLLALFGRRRN